MRWHSSLWAHKRRTNQAQPTHQIWACIERIYHVDPYSTISWVTTTHTTAYISHRAYHGSGRLCRGVIHHTALAGRCELTRPTLRPYISHHIGGIFWLSYMLDISCYIWYGDALAHMFWWTIFRQGRCTIIISYICDAVKSFKHQFFISTYVLFNTAHTGGIGVLYYMDMLSMRCMKMSY